MVYRLRVRSLSLNCSWSKWSQIIYLSTPKNLSAYIEVQGTGQYNPINSYININNSIVYNGAFTGLMLTAIHRCNLSVTYQQIFNTFTDSTQANLMASALRSFDSNHLLIIISSFAWETYFNKNLSEAISELGGYLTLPFTKNIPSIPSYATGTNSTYGYPYSFIGIPNQKYITGQNFETIRNATLYHNYNQTLYNALPPARIRVNLVFDTYRQFYFLQNNRPLRINQYEALN